MGPCPEDLALPEPSGGPDLLVWLRSSHVSCLVCRVRCCSGLMGSLIVASLAARLPSFPGGAAAGSAVSLQVCLAAAMNRPYTNAHTLTIVCFSFFCRILIERAFYNNKVNPSLMFNNIYLRDKRHGRFVTARKLIRSFVYFQINS